MPRFSVLYYRIFHSFVYIIIGAFVYGLVPQVWAQEPTGPDMGWCAQGVPGEQMCGFDSPGAACSFAVNAIYENGDFGYAGSVRTSENSARCQLTPFQGEGVPLFLGTPTAGRECASGSRLVGQSCAPTTLDPKLELNNPDSFTPCSGNPIDVITGRKRQTFVDFETADGLLRLERHYMSDAFGANNYGQTASHILGLNWSLSSHPIMRFNINNDGTRSENFTLFMPEGVAYRFNFNTFLNEYQLNSHGLVSSSDSIGVAIEVTEDAYIIRRKNGQVYRFLRDFIEPPIAPDWEVNGYLIAKLQSIDFGNGYSYFFEYGGSNISSLTDSFGRKIEFEHEIKQWFDPISETQLIFRVSAGVEAPRPDYTTLLKYAHLPDGTVLEYLYDSIDALSQQYEVPQRLTGVRHRLFKDGPVLRSESYLYEDDDHLFHLTGVVDNAGILYSSWRYNESGQAIESERSNGVEKVSITREQTSTRRNTYTVTNAVGKSTAYEGPSYTRLGAGRIEDVLGVPSANCVGSTSSVDYLTSRIRFTDREGRHTDKTFDDFGRPLTIRRAVGTVDETLEIIEWHPTRWWETRRVEPNLTTEYLRSEDGHVLQMTQTDTSAAGNGDIRTWSYSYAGPNVTVIDGPLPGSSDRQTFTYDGANLTSVTNELGQTTTITSHNPIGAPQTFTDPNGVPTRLIYDNRHRLISIIESEGLENATTTLTYSPTDLVTSITPPNGATLTFSYDDARRLMSISNAVGDRIDYTRNLLGGITGTNIQNGSGGVEFTLAQVTDEMNRVIRSIGAGGSTGGSAITSFGYDREDNLTSVTDPRNGNWSHSFDNLDRLIQEIDPLGATTDYGLTPQTGETNPLATVTDARNITTTFVRNGFGEIISETSPDAGTTIYERDERGLITQLTDARGVVSNYSYDNAGRLTAISYPASPEDNLSYSYDEGTYGIGRLTTLTENYGTTHYSYNSLGQMISQTRMVNGQSYTTSYTYSGAGDVLTTIYPSGREVRFIRDLAARIVAIDTRAADETGFTDIATGLTYTAFGPLTGAQFGDGTNLGVTYDTGYKALTLRRTSPTGSLMDISFEYDAVGDILAMNDNVRLERSQNFSYDAVSRLTSASGEYGDITYGYNAVGDRTSRDWTQLLEDGTTSSRSETYTYAQAHLTDISVNSDIVRMFDYAPSGQVIRDERLGETTSVLEYQLNGRGRLSRVMEKGASAASYIYDDDQQRISKSVGGTITHYHYDDEGRLISETDGSTGAVKRDYIWLGLTPIAVIANTRDDGPDDMCDEERIADLETRIAARQNSLQNKEERLANNLERIANKEASIVTQQGRITTKQGRIANKQESIDNKTNRIAEIQETLAGVNPENTDRIATLQARIAELEADIVRLTGEIVELEAEIIGHEDRIDELDSEILSIGVTNIALEDDIERLTERIAVLQERLANAQAVCEAANDNGDGTETISAQLFFLHADHLGRPQFATDSAGAVVWDGGATTPFGEGVNTAGAFVQNLMFPGQYADAETGLFHNWNRSYDPTLGRYLQSDPIGLDGGINRYAYAESIPTYFVDPTGEFVPIVVGAALGVAFDYALEKFKDARCNCNTSGFPDTSTGVNAAAGAAQGAFGPFERKPRQGFGGGGPSGDRSSTFSRMSRQARDRGLISRDTQRALNRNARRLARRLPYVSGVLAVAQLYDAASCG